MMTKEKPVITVASQCSDLTVVYKYKYNCKTIVWVAETKYINNICISYVTPCHYICATDANSPEKKDQLLNLMNTAWPSFLYNIYSHVVVSNYGQHLNGTLVNA